MAKIKKTITYTHVSVWNVYADSEEGLAEVKKDLEESIDRFGVTKVEHERGSASRARSAANILKEE